MMEITSLKSNARKTLTKKDSILVQTLIGTLSRISFLTYLFINTMSFYIFLLLYGILAILFFKFTLEITKPNRRQA